LVLVAAAGRHAETGRAAWLRYAAVSDDLIRKSIPHLSHFVDVGVKVLQRRGECSVLKSLDVSQKRDLLE